MQANTRIKIKNKTGLKLLVQTLMIALSLLLITACGNDAFYEEFRTVDEETWNLHEIKEFPVLINDTTASYTLIFTIRNTTDYAYSNLYLFLTTVYPDNTATRDTVEFMLADRSGRWLGKGFGKIRESRFMVKDQLRLPQAGDYLFAIQQAMRHESLHGIADVGLRIEKTEAQK